MDSKTPPEQPRQIYVLRASIAEIRPQIWRKLSVPGGCTLGDLHWILQAAFGWDNDHMHSFTVNSEEYGMTGSDFGSGDDYDVTDEDDVCLDDLELQPKQKFTYLYDFGDSWKHDISVSQIVPGGLEDKGTERPRCLGGQRAGPLEDSGGPWGYMDMIEILKDPSHERYEEFHEWAGDRDPEYFDPEQVNARL
ncbi:MAG: plasmid pRiA4b ORF-3 family protein, partial [Spirochaetaceae bacterium]|nr:plasmid pRiA4b ORF-3 family protein [Spirochaetaceae bacterium]